MRTICVRAYLAEFFGTFFLVFTFLSAAASSLELASFSVAAVLVASIWAGAHISGAHFNPAISLGVYLRRGLPLVDLLSYWAAQLLGALVASTVGLWVFDLPHRALDVASGPSFLPALLVEFLFTFALVYVVLSIGQSKEQDHNIFYGAAMGFVVLAGMLTVGEISGAAFNPAIAFGMSIDGEFAWSSIGVYLVAELAGGVAASVFAGKVVTA